VSQSPQKITFNLYSNWGIAQRYSFVLNADQPVDNYWIRALPDSGNRNLSSTFENGVNSAILRYSGAPDKEPTSEEPPLTNPLVEANLHPFTPIPVPGEPRPDGADRIFDLKFGFNALGNFTINGAAFAPPTVPVLLQILSGTKSAHDLLPKGSVYTLERNKTIQVNLPSNFTGGPHPFHLHGVSIFPGRAHL
jgi:iron transport multicopper oxidase